MAVSRVYDDVTSDVIGLDAATEIAPVSESCRLTALFGAHHQRLYRLARRLVATGDEAEDLVQETFLRVARAPHSVPPGPVSAEAWLVRILVNLCRDRWRRRAFRSRETSARSADFQAAAASDQETIYIAQATVWQALRDLPPRRRAVIILHELEGNGVADVARLLGIAAVTVRWHLSRGRHDLAAIIRSDNCHD
jgi:RNA polymerase sigma-70 factor (ECF subfamily)